LDKVKLLYHAIVVTAISFHIATEIMKPLWYYKKTNCTHLKNNFCFYSEKVAITFLFAIGEAFNQSDHCYGVTITSTTQYQLGIMQRTW